MVVKKTTEKEKLSTFFTHEERIALIYKHQIHGVSIRRIAKDMKKNYSTVFNIINAFQKLKGISPTRMTMILLGLNKIQTKSMLSFAAPGKETTGLGLPQSHCNS